jgi:hypothetical protein
MTKTSWLAVGLALTAALTACKKAPAPDSDEANPSGPKPPPTILEHEPNDAQHAQAIPPHAIVLGEIGSPKKAGAADDDWYRVDVGAGQKLALRIELTSATPVASVTPTPGLGPLDAQLEVNDRDRNRLLLAHATSGEPLLMPAVLCFESCFVHIWGTAPAAYKLTVLGDAPLDSQELEPNDRAIDATPLAAGKSIAGTLSSPDDEDWYRVTAAAKAGQFLRVELTGVPGLRPELELRSLADGALLATFRAAAEGEGITLRDISLSGDITPPEPPRLRPLVAAGSDAGADDAGPLSADAGERMDGSTDSLTAVDAGAPTPSAQAPAQAPSAQAQDALAQAPGGPDADAGPDSIDAGADAGTANAIAANPIAANPIDANPIDAGAQAALPAPAIAAPVTTLVVDAGAVAAVDAGGAAVVPLTGLAAIAPTVQGYYLVVKSSPLTDEKKAPRGANQHATYSLQAVLEAGPPDLEAEPNDDAQHATWIVQTRAGYLAPAGDKDWYRVRNEGKSVLRAEVTGLQRADLELSVFAAPAHPGDKPVLLAHANEGGVREGEVLPAVGIDGDALVQVQCAARDLDGVKVRDCEDRDGPYKLTIALAADDGALEREPNDDLDHAQAIAVPTQITGTLWPKRDVDVFRFDLDADRTLSFRLSALRGVDTMLTLRELKLNKKGKLVGDVMGTADASRGEGREEIVAVPLKPGSYSIEVSSPKRDGTATQPYTLQIQ